MSALPVVARRAVGAPLAVAAVALGGTILLTLVDPGRHALLPCPLRALTGLACPACGGLRATADLAVGDLAGAFAMNPLWVLAVPPLILAWVLWTRRAWRGEPSRPLPATAWWAIGAVLVAFTVLRNVPVLTPWLGPAW